MTDPVFVFHPLMRKTQAPKANSFQRLQSAGVGLDLDSNSERRDQLGTRDSDREEKPFPDLLPGSSCRPAVLVPEPLAAGSAGVPRPLLDAAATAAPPVRVRRSQAPRP